MVAAERHYDSLRAQLTAATAVGAVTGLISLGLAPLLGLNAPSMLSVESAFWAFIVASSAGLLYCAVLCSAPAREADLLCSLAEHVNYLSVRLFVQDLLRLLL